MVENGARIEEDFEEYHAGRTRAESYNGQAFDEHGDGNFQGMESKTRACVKIVICVMYLMDSPE